MDTPTHWTVRHFSQANPAGPGCDSVPALLRRLADAIEALGPAEIQDVVIQHEMTEHVHGARGRSTSTCPGTRTY